MHAHGHCTRCLVQHSFLTQLLIGAALPISAESEI
eukprot:SAG11_NODE_31037_length_295_cov_1.056122_1_plen_34_part_01